MRKVWIQGVVAAIAVCLFMLAPLRANAADGGGRLVSVPWLAQQLGSADLVLIDASPAQVHAARHIAGASSLDIYALGARELSSADTEALFRAHGIGPDKRVVLYDQGGSMMATRVFFDLLHAGFPAERLFILDGGLAKWQATGHPVTKEPTPPRAAGSFRAGPADEDVRTRLDEFVAASGKPATHALVEALEPGYHFGETKFFDRAGHVPHAVMLPSGDFYNADKTFKSPAEIRRMVDYLGIKPQQQVLAHCGGGVAASVPFFALKFMLGFPNVKMYKESQLEWLQDQRQLPFWTYDAPYLKREADWLQGWSNRMMRIYGVTQISVLDVRPATQYAQGHVPFALNVPAETFRQLAAEPQKLAALLGPAGVDATQEAVIVADGGLTESAALAFLMLERLGQQRVSILMDSVDEWGLRGHPLAKEATVVGAKKSPNDVSVPPTAYPLRARPVVVSAADPPLGAYPRVFIAAGASAPAAGSREGKLVHLPYTTLLNADRTPKPAKELWSLLSKAGVPRYAEIVCIADTPGEAAAMYYLLRLMGYPDVKVQVA
jgi:thiosulfate/3-mercaptopyruvate sulfurtransferase